MLQFQSRARTRLCTVALAAMCIWSYGCTRTSPPTPPGVINGVGSVWYQWRPSAFELAIANAIRVRPGLWLATDHARPRSGVRCATGDGARDSVPVELVALVDPVSGHQPRALSARDWALVRTVEHRTAPSARIAWTRAPDVGDRVWVVGVEFDETLEPGSPWAEVSPRVHSGRVRRFPNWTVPEDERGGLIAFSLDESAPLGGFSGSPVVNENGEVVAMYLGRIRKRAGWIGLDTVYIARLLDEEICAAID